MMICKFLLFNNYDNVLANLDHFCIPISSNEKLHFGSICGLIRI